MFSNQEIDLMLIKSCKSSFSVSNDLFSLGFSGLTSAQHKHANKPLSDEEEEEVDFFPSMTWKVAFSVERVGQICTEEAFSCGDVSWAVLGHAGQILVPAVRNKEALLFFGRGH